MTKHQLVFHKACFSKSRDRCSQDCHRIHAKLVYCLIKQWWLYIWMNHSYKFQIIAVINLSVASFIDEWQIENDKRRSLHLELICVCVCTAKWFKKANMYPEITLQFSGLPWANFCKKGRHSGGHISGMPPLFSILQNPGKASRGGPGFDRLADKWRGICPAYPEVVKEVC